jgi:hypothetical protein
VAPGFEPPWPGSRTTVGDRPEAGGDPCAGLAAIAQASMRVGNFTTCRI